MSNNIFNLKMKDEDKILLSKINKRVSFLSNKADTYLSEQVVIRTDAIEEAYSVNEDLISILRENDELTKDLREESFSIRVNHQADFTREVHLSVTEEIKENSLIKSTIEHKDKLITSDEKLYALSKRRNFIKSPTSKRKAEMLSTLDSLEDRINNEQLLSIEPMKEDIMLINKFINPKEINKTWWIYVFVLIPFITLVLLLGGVLIWIV